MATQESGDDLTTTQRTFTQADNDTDVPWIAALVCFGVGGFLIIIGIIRLILYATKNRKHKRKRKWILRRLEHKRHLDQYSVRTGDAVSLHSHITASSRDFNHNEASAGNAQIAWIYSYETGNAKDYGHARSASVHDLDVYGGNAIYSELNSSAHFVYVNDARQDDSLGNLHGGHGDASHSRNQYELSGTL